MGNEEEKLNSGKSNDKRVDETTNTEIEEMQKTISDKISKTAGIPQSEDLDEDEVDKRIVPQNKEITLKPKKKESNEHEISGDFRKPSVGDPDWKPGIEDRLNPDEDYDFSGSEEENREQTGEIQIKKPGLMERLGSWLNPKRLVKRLFSPKSWFRNKPARPGRVIDNEKEE